ncbi:hypothetical protein ABFK62_03045 [Acinetobacter baumannii]|uniref:hypothetical protein n=1 Tax=Acinetobacter baumannii TaxID=470 RepID=UPI0007432738|nr:hypothetical protein [Acinetobacter baumannii]MBZ0484685.1 hypothetical protein [Acinetobacter baumannii]HCT9561369.1 hypothetical protein [Acinetobacter baumannii]
MHEKFQAWIKDQPFYSKLVFQHGERLFIREGDGYKILVIEVVWHLWKKIPDIESILKEIENTYLLPKGEEILPVPSSLCPGCMRKKLNLGGYQPCSCQKKIVWFPPKKP